MKISEMGVTEVVAHFQQSALAVDREHVTTPGIDPHRHNLAISRDGLANALDYLGQERIQVNAKGMIDFYRKC